MHRGYLTTVSRIIFGSNSQGPTECSILVSSTVTQQTRVSDYCITKRLKSSKNNTSISFIIAITLHFSVSVDHRQMVTFYAVLCDQNGSIFQRHRLKTVCVFWDEYTKI
jgi:hypothetical protein